MPCHPSRALRSTSKTLTTPWDQFAKIRIFLDCIPAYIDWNCQWAPKWQPFNFLCSDFRLVLPKPTLAGSIHILPVYTHSCPHFFFVQTHIFGDLNPTSSKTKSQCWSNSTIESYPPFIANIPIIVRLNLHSCSLSPYFWYNNPHF